MAASRISRKAGLARDIEVQRRWIREHGNSRAGYIERYGSVTDPEHYGEGGEAIYAADIAALDQLESIYNTL